MSDKSDVIVVFDCAHCGRHLNEIVHHHSCQVQAVERTFVAVDALLSDEAVQAAADALTAHRTMPGPRMTRDARDAIEAAIALTGKQP
jgi:hypothetical protein